ncbi:MAG: DUF2071 domain-containing protein [Ktedonobacteraceae bacterium]
MDTRSILKATDHRTTSLPTGPWAMTQIWHELLFAHWPIAPDMLRPLIPSTLPLDTFDGQCWVGIVPFHMSNVHPRGIPSVPGLSQFPELNVRTYVTLQDRPGVYFFSLDAGNAIAVAIARSVFHLPYFKAQMSSRRIEDTIYYRSHRVHTNAPSADYIATYRPIAPVVYALRGTIEHWLTERYYLYTTVRRDRDRVYRGDIHHRLWPLQIAELEVMRDTMTYSHGIHLPDTAPLLHYSQVQEVLIWPLRRIL